jgi:mono/diheme cytochrome c family protein
MRGRSLLLVVLVLGVPPVGIAGCNDTNGDAERRGSAGSASADAADAPPIDPRIAASLPQGVTIQMATQGQQLFNSVCVACHGPGGEGTQLAPSLRDEDWIHITGEIDEITNLVRTGVPDPEEYPIPMPPLGGGAFTEAELRAVAAYVYALRHGAR